MKAGDSRLEPVGWKCNLAVTSDWVIATFAGGLLGAISPTFLQVLLVVFLSSVELLCWQNLSDDLPIKKFLLHLTGISRSLLLL